MPYVYAQAKDCSERGLPMVRALLVEFPQDPGAWLVEDEYMFGSQILVAPLLESGNSRTVYLPSSPSPTGEGRGEVTKWIDYQTGKVYDGGYQTIEAGRIPAIILVRDGSLIPHAPLAIRALILGGELDATGEGGLEELVEAVFLEGGLASVEGGNEVLVVVSTDDLHAVGSHHQSCGQTDVAQSDNVDHIRFTLRLLFSIFISTLMPVNWPLISH